MVEALFDGVLLATYCPYPFQGLHIDSVKLAIMGMFTSQECLHHGNLHVLQIKVGWIVCLFVSKRAGC